MDISNVYEMLPMLSQMPVEQYISAAANVDGAIKSQVAKAFTSLFYKELGMDINKIQQDYIVVTGAKMLLLVLAGTLIAIVVGFFSARISASVAKKLRRDVFAKVSMFSNEEFDKFSTASLITRTTNDVHQVQMMIVMGIRILCYAPIMGIGGIIMALNKSLSMSWIIALAVILLLCVIALLYVIVVPKFKLLQKLIDKLNLISRENLSGLMVIRAFRNEKHEENRFGEANKNLADTNRFVQRSIAFMMPLMMLFMNTISLLIIWVGAHAIAASTIQIGDMMAFIQYAMQIIMSFVMIAMIFIMLPRASVSAVRINEVLNTELVIKDKESVKKFETITGNIEFKNVSFRYTNAETDVLQNISFTAKAGETTAFIGATGSGKSTLINLIPRFYDVTAGEILIDGVDIRDVEQHALRDNIGYIPQKGILFMGDMESNIKFGKEDAETGEITEAVEIAQAKEFFDLTSPISQGGVNVSGGQKQRLAIARALVKKPPIYIFDDSFSALDFKTDSALRQALKQYTNDSTILIVAQRVSTIMNAEQIIVLDHGKIVEKGTHMELLKTCVEYREIAESQLSKEELA
ncbi:MAG: ABC transporter ATP-binding protein/permease [Oscillospiraceae bacterium]|nr:ABC transporter ATP-binding protein/permease [Oscillospiraceae bacterium]